MSSKANPIGIEKQGEKIQSLSCVGIAHPTTSPAPAAKAESLPERKGDKQQKVLGDEGASAVDVGVSHKPIETLSELWATVGCRSVWKAVKAPAPAAAAAAAKVTGKVTGKPAGGAPPVSPVVGLVAVLVREVEPEAIQLDPEATQETGGQGWAQVARDDADGVVRVRDEYADDLSAWED